MTYREIWEDSFGRSIKEGWVIHHINHNHFDNRIQNLLHIPNKMHIQYHSLYNKITPSIHNICQINGENFIYTAFQCKEMLEETLTLINSKIEIFSDMISANQIHSLMLEEVSFPLGINLILDTEKYLDKKYS